MITHQKINKMKKAITLLVFVFITSIIAEAQVFPYGINYQGVARNAAGNAQSNQQVPIQFTIYKTTATGTVIWQERQVRTTNSMGQFNAVIGTGTPVTPFTTGSFSQINWSGDSTFLKIELNSNTSFTGTFTQIGNTTKFQAVPYALAAPDATPAGVILAYGGISAPSGYLICHGQAISRTSYANLFAAIGTAYGNGDGSTTFNVPDFRGMFLRGADSTAINDPDAAARTSVNGGNSGAKVGSVEADGSKSHNHTVNAVGVTNFAGGSTGWGFYGSGSTSGVVNSTGGNETRPKNVYVNYIIKY